MSAPEARPCACHLVDPRACLVDQYTGEAMLLREEVCGCACHPSPPAGTPVLMPYVRPTLRLVP